MRRIVWFSFVCLFALSVEAGAKKKSRYSFKRDKEVGAKVLIDSKGGLQFACKRCRMKTYKTPKATETEPAWEGIMTSPEKIVIRWMLEESDSPYGTDAAALTTHLQAQADLGKIPIRRFGSTSPSSTDRTCSTAWGSPKQVETSA